MDKSPKIAFIGGGNMASSLIHGLIKSGYETSAIAVSDHNSEKRERLQKAYNVKVSESDIEVVKNAAVILIAVKPQDIHTVALTLKNQFKPPFPLILSIAAGVSCTILSRWFGEEFAIVRAMPNTAALLQIGATGLYSSSKVTEEQKSLSESIMRAVGITVWVNHEHDMDTITALSGSGPAYFFYMMQALQRGAENLGLSSNTAKILTLQTALGAARMALESELPLDALIARVSSKGGTTEKALSMLESGNFSDLLKAALTAAKERSQEISDSFE